MTKEQYEKLTQYEQELRYAVKLNFMSMPNSKFNDIMAIYNELYPALNPRQLACSTCRLNALKKMGADYFSYQQAIAEEQKEEREEENKPKRGRPKKIDLDAVE